MKVEVKTLRDEIAMSLDATLIPTLTGSDAIADMCEVIGHIVPDTDMGLIEFAMYYQSVIRYKYADAMLLARQGKI